MTGTLALVFISRIRRRFLAFACQNGRFSHILPGRIVMWRPVAQLWSPFAARCVRTRRLPSIACRRSRGQFSALRRAATIIGVRGQPTRGARCHRRLVLICYTPGPQRRVRLKIQLVLTQLHIQVEIAVRVSVSGRGGRTGNWGFGGRAREIRDRGFGKGGRGIRDRGTGGSSGPARGRGTGGRRGRTRGCGVGGEGRGIRRWRHRMVR